MKKYNKNSILFFFAVLFVLTGFFGSALFDLAKVGVKALYALKQGDVSKIVSIRILDRAEKQNRRGEYSNHGVKDN